MPITAGSLLKGEPYWAMENNSFELMINDAEAIRAFGKKLGKTLFPGAFVALFGGLGAGKTTLVTGLAEALSVYDISSPTFTIVKRHFGSLILDHFDAYRIESEDELYAMGYEDHLQSESVIVMEWCENVPDALPAERLELHIQGSGSEPRRVTVAAYGAEYKKTAEELCRC